MCQSLVVVGERVFNVFAWFLKFKILSIFHWKVNSEKDQLYNNNISHGLYRPLWDHIRIFI